MTDIAPASLTPLRLAAAGGILWNTFGLFQFYTTSFSTIDALVGMGMTQVQAQLYASLPFWMHLAFGIGTAGGLIGSLLMIMRKRLALPILAASLLGYVALFVGDWALGVFAAFGLTQVIILSVVLAIAAALWWGARRWAAKGLLS